MEVGETSIKREHLSIDIVHDGDDHNLLSSIKEKMESISLSHCLCRVPEELFKGNEEKYFPFLVSIGPFHHDKDTLKDQKWQYLNALLSREPNAEATLESCIRALRQMEPSARKFYGETIEMGSDQFVEMMLLDGCFIIELFLVCAIKSLRRRDDRCFSTNEGLFRLRCELILFENQLPFFILDHLFHLVPIPKNCHLSLIQLALCFFKKLIPDYGPHFHQEITGPQTVHLLDLIRQHYLPTYPEIVSTGVQTNINPATRLCAHGISVEKANSESPSNITFSNGQLKIPSLQIHCYTETLFRNFIAMEYCQPGCSKHVTSYVVFMERLIRGKKDVRLLQDREIIIDGHEKEGEIWFLFKRLHVDVNVKDFCYRGLCEQVSLHQPRKRQVWWQSVRNVYHKTDVGIAGFSLAMLALVFLFTGAFFTIVYFLLHHFRL